MSGLSLARVVPRQAASFSSENRAMVPIDPARRILRTLAVHLTSFNPAAAWFLQRHVGK